MAYTKEDALRCKAIYRITKPSVLAHPLVLERHALLDEGKLHPDGKAWDKCCCGDTLISPGMSVECAFTAKRLTKETCTPEVPFVCLHRTEDGCLRVCAGWDACFRKAQDK